MRIEYQLTIDDFREAHHGPPGAPSSSAPRGKPVFTWLLFLAMSALVLMLVRNQSAANRSPVAAESQPPAPPGWRLAAATVPSVLFFGLVASLSVRQARRPFPKPWERPQADPRGRRKGPPGTLTPRELAVWLAIIIAIIVGVAFQVLTERQAHIPGPPPAWQLVTLADFMPGVAPWVMIVGLLVVIGNASHGERGLRKLWDAQPFLTPPKATEFADTSLTIADARSRIEHRWENFAGFKETPALFVLYLSPISFHLIPKRAFAAASPDALDAFRGLLLNRVKHGHFLERPAAFAVVPFATAVPSQPVATPAR